MFKVCSMSRGLLFGVGMFGLALATAGTARAGVAMYTATPLGFLPGYTSSEAFGINAGGEVVGVSFSPFIPSSVDSAFLYDATGMHLLGPGDGIAINNAGQTVVAVNSSNDQTFVYGPGGSVTMLPGSPVSGSAINNAGQVAGTFNLNASKAAAFIYSNGSVNLLGTLGGTSSDATGINDLGQVVGYSMTAAGASHAFLYSGGAMHDLGTLGGTDSTAYAINTNGDVVGVADTGNTVEGFPVEHAFLYSNGVMHDLGTLGTSNSDARAINDLGQVVGGSYYGPIAQSQAYVYEDGTMYDLNSLVVGAPDFILELAFGINDSGQIVADARLPDGMGEAVLLTPTAAAVPLPPAAWMGLIVIGGLVLARLSARPQRACPR